MTKVTLKSSRKEFVYENDSGYRFNIVAEFDDERGGWDAGVAINAYGLDTPENAVLTLKRSVEQLLKMLNEGVE